MSNQTNSAIQLDGYLVDRIIEMFEHPKCRADGVCNYIDELLDADMYTERESLQLQEVLSQIKEKQRTLCMAELSADDWLIRLLSRQENIGSYYAVRLTVLKALHPHGRGVW